MGVGDRLRKAAALMELIVGARPALEVRHWRGQFRRAQLDLGRASHRRKEFPTDSWLIGGSLCERLLSLTVAGLLKGSRAEG